MGAFFHPSCTVLKGNSGISKIKGTCLWTFVPNSGLRRFCFGMSIVETCYRLSSTMVDAQNVVNWTVVGESKHSQLLFRELKENIQPGLLFDE